MREMARLASAAAGLAVAALVHAQGADELWQMTTRMEMEGMQLPAAQQQVCMKKGETRAEGLGQQDPNCKVTEQRRSGNKLTWKVVCTGENAMTGTGEMTRNRDTLEGRMLMKGRDGEMKIVYSGRLGGTCNAQTHRDPQVAAMQQQVAAMQAQSDAQIAQMCRESIERFNTPMFEMAGSPCAARAGEYCAHVKKTAQSMRRWEREEERKAEQLPYAQLAVPAAYLGLAGAQMNLRDKLFGGGAPERIAGADFARQVEAGGARDMQRQQLEEARAGNEYLRSLVDLERARKNLAVLSR